MKFKDNSGFIYELNERDSTASIVKLTQKVKDIIIPTFIEYENKKYIITIIESNAIYSSSEEITISFAEDSKIKTFKSYSFYGPITSIEIPKTLECYEPSSIRMNFEKCWHTINPHIYVSKDNQLFFSPDTKYLYGKSQKDLNYFDTLVYVTPDIKEVNILPNIKIIKSSALSNCKSLKFTDDSQIETIEEYQSNNLTKIFIPQNLQNFGENLFKYIKEIEILPLNNRYKYVDDKYLLMKSDIKNEIYDELVWINRTFHDAVIPNYIKKIHRFALYDIHEISFEEGSIIETLEGNLIQSYDEIVFPPSIKVLKENTIGDGEYLYSIIFESEEITIERGALGVSPYYCIQFPNAKKITFNEDIPDNFVVRVRRDAELKGFFFEQKHSRPQFYDDVAVSKEKLDQLFEYVRSLERQLSEIKEIKPYDLDSLLDKEISSKEEIISDE